MKTSIKFGTDGWRAIIAKEFTTENVARVAVATALWLKNQSAEPVAVVGHDCRFGGKLFAETVTKVLTAHGVKVYLAEGIVSTPMISLACFQLKANVGVVITASHNPADYNGYKLKSTYGGPTTPEEIAKVEDLIPETAEVPETSIAQLIAEGKVVITPMEDMYYEHAQKSFDLAAIKNSGMVFAYDAMYGAGQRIVPRLLPDIIMLHGNHNPGFDGTAPEPLHKNLLEFSQLISNTTDVAFGFANDGDADRIGVYNGKGKFIDSHHVILLLIHYLHKYKGEGGKVVVSFTVSNRVKKMCEAYGLPIEVTKVGFKYICEIMVNEDVLVGGEESGGIAIKGHIPERDGVWNALVLMEYIAKSGKTLDELIEEVYAVTGSFDFDRYDLHITEDLKQRIVKKCTEGAYNSFGPFKVQSVETIDGWKYHLDENSWVMIRASGTEPVLRVYSESTDAAAVKNILDTVKEILLAE